LARVGGVLLPLLLAGRAAPGQPAPEPPPQLQITTVSPSTVELETPPTEQQKKALLRRLTNARKALRALGGKGPTIPIATRHSLSAELERLDQLLSASTPRCNPVSEVKRLEQDLALAASGDTPHTRAGVHRLAYRSPLDRGLHQFVAYVPPGYPASTGRYPLVVMLHGMRSTAMRGIGRLFGVADEQLKDEHVTCDRPRLGGQEALVVAPHAFGDTFYRLAGERDVTTVVQMMTRLYRVDRARITITGLSMGGTGAVELALQQPHQYAGVVALCGYYDRRLDSRFRGQKLQPWEQMMMTVYSPVDWAENGRDTPLVLLHGAWDGPQRARAMEKRYQQLGFSVKLETFQKGHDVWVPGYEKGRIFATLAKFRRRAAPRRVSFVSGRSRVRKSHWVVIEAWEDYSRWARVDAEIKSPKLVKVTTDNVAALRLDLPSSHLARRQPVQISVDGTELEAGPLRNRWVQRVRLRREASAWQLVPGKPSRPPDMVKRPGLAGPIEDIRFDPIVVVYGTGGGQAALLKKLALKIAGYSRHADLEYPVIPDRRYTPRSARGRSVIMVGNEQTNRALARLGPKLPIRVTAEEIRFGKESLRRPNIGATYVFPNPDSPSWYLLVVAGTTEASYELWRQLPALLPDYMVFDDSLHARRWRMVLGSDRSVVKAGYFDSSWRLPAASR